jgi:hypothetical protein
MHANVNGAGDELCGPPLQHSAFWPWNCRRRLPRSRRTKYIESKQARRRHDARGHHYVQKQASTRVVVVVCQSRFIHHPGTDTTDSTSSPSTWNQNMCSTLLKPSTWAPFCLCCCNPISVFPLLRCFSRVFSWRPTNMPRIQITWNCMYKAGSGYNEIRAVQSQNLTHRFDDRLIGIRVNVIQVGFPPPFSQS